mmetsp:Transcript_19591/g.75149  ORF Transcript_19591/g.75149 Transcript_19591/m.75149 type:complete len:221 (-) Transcript_19591:1557-2219(-)
MRPSAATLPAETTLGPLVGRLEARCHTSRRRRNRHPCSPWPALWSRQPLPSSLEVVQPSVSRRPQRLAGRRKRQLPGRRGRSRRQPQQRQRPVTHRSAVWSWIAHTFHPPQRRAHGGSQSLNSPPAADFPQAPTRGPRWRSSWRPTRWRTSGSGLGWPWRGLGSGAQAGSGCWPASNGSLSGLRDSSGRPLRERLVARQQPPRPLRGRRSLRCGQGVSDA